jgi:hypothetical protein
VYKKLFSLFDSKVKGLLPETINVCYDNIANNVSETSKYMPEYETKTIGSN